MSADHGDCEKGATGLSCLVEGAVECEELFLTLQCGTDSVQGTSNEQRGLGLHLLQDSSIP